MIQASRILAIVAQRAWPVTAPIPKSAPQLTCVVETGTPSRLAPITTNPVTRLAVNPCPAFIGVILWLISTKTKFQQRPRIAMAPSGDFFMTMDGLSFDTNFNKYSV